MPAARSRGPTRSRRPRARPSPTPSSREVARNLRSVVWLGATETYAVSEMLVTPADVAETIGAPAVARWADEESSGERYVALGRAHAAGASAPMGLADETLVMMRGEFKKFVNDRVLPLAQSIHRKDVLIPMDLVQAMSEMGVFGITIPEAYGGQGLGKVAMCVITEELSRGYIGVGSLGTRAEIAAELILHGGTEAQKQKWLPPIATGEVLPTAVFTEPDYGSDLAHLKSRAIAGRRRLARSTATRRGSRTPSRATLMTRPGAHRPVEAGPRRALDVPRARSTGQAKAQDFVGPGPHRHGDQGPRLPRHEGVRAVVRRLPRARRRAARRRRRAPRASGSSWRPSRARASRRPRAASASRRPRSTRR